jgi:ketosteroid isomerase-like protein
MSAQKIQDRSLVMEDAGWVRRLFAAVDAQDIETFLSFLRDDARFRFGNAPAVTGKDAIRAALAAFFASIRGLRHEIPHIWFPAETVICEGESTYTRTDGTTVTIPFVTVWRMRGDRIQDYRIYIDMQPLFAPAS